MTFKVRDNQGPIGEEHEDKRDLIQRMFFNHNPKTGELEPLDIQPVKEGEDYKSYSDCIPLVKNYMAQNNEYHGDLKGKTVVVIGGRRKGRAGTGVDLIIDIEDINSFSSLLCQIGDVARESVRENTVVTQQVA